MFHPKWLYVFFYTFVFCTCFSMADFEYLNLISNGSFESVDESLPNYWSLEKQDEITAALSLDKGRGEGNAIKLEGSHSNGNSAKIPAKLIQRSQVFVESGKWYRLMVWAKQNGISEL